jgi:hypothetical protein
MSKDGGDTGLRIVLPDPDQEDLLHLFDPEERGGPGGTKTLRKIRAWCSY